MIKFSSKRFAFLAAVAAAALTVSAQKANANPTTVTVNEYGASSGLSGVSSGQQADSVYSDGGPSAPDITTTAYFFRHFQLLTSGVRMEMAGWTLRTP
jgi:hypothetical protein